MSDDRFMFGQVLLHQEFGERFLYAGFGVERDGEYFLPACPVLVPKWSVQYVSWRTTSRYGYEDRGAYRMRLKGVHCSIASDFDYDRRVTLEAFTTGPPQVLMEKYGEFALVVMASGIELPRAPFSALGQVVKLKGRERLVTTVIVFPRHITFGLQGGPERGIDFSPFAGEGSPIPPWRLDLGDCYEPTHEGISW